MFAVYFWALVCLVPFLALVLHLSLLLANLDRAVNERTPFSALRWDVPALLRARGQYGPPHFYMATLLFCLAFALIPMGSLPAYLLTLADSITLPALLLAAQFIYARGLKLSVAEVYSRLEGRGDSRLVRFCIVFIIVCNSLALYMLASGVPGSVVSLESVAATPLWLVAGWPGKLGLICFFWLFAIFSLSRGSEAFLLDEEAGMLVLYEALRRAIGPALCTVIFLPWNPAVKFGLRGYNMFIADFAFFGVKVFLLQAFVLPAVRQVYNVCAAKRRPPWSANFDLFVLAVMGAIFLALDFFI